MNLLSKVKRIGIECHNLEEKRFGVGQTLIQLLQEISRMPEAAENFEFYLYFKKKIPKDKALESPIFKKRILRLPFFPASFTFFYHILIPVQYFRDRLDGFFFPGYMLPAFFAGKSIVTLTNDVYYEAHQGNLPLRYRAAYRIFSWWAAKRANKILTISETARSEIARNYKIPPKKIFVNPWGLDRNLSDAAFADADIERAKKKFGVKDDFIFSWGQAFPRRHFKEAILAFGRIAPNFPRLQYFLACTDKYNPPILKITAEKVNKNLGREAIVLADYIASQDDLFALVRGTRLAVYISESEAMGLPPLEALSLGTPSLVADNDLNREIFGGSAFKVKNPGDIDEMAQKIAAALSDEERRRRIAENGPNIAKKFSWGSCAGALLKIFRETF